MLARKLVSTNLFMKNSFTILHIMRNILNNVKKFFREKSDYKHKIGAFLLLKKMVENWRLWRLLNGMYSLSFFR
jgi:hypothetical protein